MKTIFLSLILLLLAISSPAQTNLVFTNDVQIGQSGIHFALVSNSRWLSPVPMPHSYNETQLFAEEKIYHLFYNATSNQFRGVQLVKKTGFQLELKNTNGIAIPRTLQGEAYFKKPEKPIKLGGISNGASELPQLTDLFNFPSNGEYVLEAKHWYWNPDKGQILLSDPVRVKVIARNIAPTNALPQK